MHSNGVQPLSTAIEAFAVPLRMGEGIDEAALQELRQVLADTAAQWRTQQTVPKGTAALLVELYPALIGTVDLYDSEQAEQVRYVCEELLELSLACVTAEDGE